ncbi:flagellar basal body rod protein FlgB [Endozoicomonas sp. Mp262]|uniref:flagellar basal body rod protein FlgB n=1 Tax=Endozoicomonas sp. Mp262 TaxID=2919499 RepID=UPI0021DA6B06
MISFEKALGIHPAALRFRIDRAEVLAANLANVDTPNFLARDISFEQVLNDQMKGDGTTSAGHISIGAAGGMSNPLYRIPSQPSSDGNTVELHLEQAEFTRNSLQFQSSFTFLNSKLKSLELAINGRV